MSSTSSYIGVDKAKLIKARLINGHRAAVLFWRVLKFHQAYIVNFDTISVVDRDNYLKDDQFLSLRCHDKMIMMQLQESQLPPVRQDRDILDDSEPFESGTCRVHRTVVVDGTPVTDFLPFASWDRDAPWIRRGRCVCRRGVEFGGARCNRNCRGGRIFCDCCSANRCACSCGRCDPSSTSSGDSSEDDYDFEFPFRFHLLEPHEFKQYEKFDFIYPPYQFQTKRLLEAWLPAGLYSCVSCACCDAMVGALSQVEL